MADTAIMHDHVILWVTFPNTQIAYNIQSPKREEIVLRGAVCCVAQFAASCIDYSFQINSGFELQALRNDIRNFFCSFRQPQAVVALGEGKIQQCTI